MRSLLVGLLCLGASNVSHAQSTNPTEPRYRIYLDADQSHTREAGQSIYQGLSTALSEAGNRLGPYPVDIVIKDHRRNSTRSVDHVKECINDPLAICMVGGMHTPAILAGLPLIQENKLLHLNPWAAGAAITRKHAGAENWVFRLSVDDSKVASYLVKTMRSRGFSKPFLLTEKTSWGTANNVALKQAIQVESLAEANEHQFSWNIGANSANLIIDKVVASEADCVLLVANPQEAQQLLQVLWRKKPTLPVISHWGISGADPSTLLPKHEKKIDLEFLQTRFSFTTYPDDPMGLRVMQRAIRTFPELKENGIQAPVGFIHAYDLGKLLIAAADQSQMAGNGIQEKRNGLRLALEDLKTPVPGLIKTYKRPFSNRGPDSHEALGSEDFAMGRFTKDGRILLNRSDKQYPRGE